MQFTQRLLSASRELRLAAGLLRSGLFDAGSYGRRNPDISGPALRHAWHYVRYGRSEERRFRRGPLSLWLLPHVLEGHVSAGHVRRLIGLTGHQAGEARNAHIADFCDRYGLDPAGYAFWTAYTAGDFDTAEDIAGQLKGVEAFRAMQRLAVRVLRTRHLNAAFEWGLDCLPDDSSPQHLAALADMAEALGRDSPATNRRLVAALLDASPAPHGLQLHLWRMRLPVISVHDAVVPLQDILPHGLASSLADDAAGQPESTRGWEPLFAAATHNLLEETPVRLQADLSPSGILRGWSRTEADAGPAILLRLPHATHWLAAGTSALSASFIAAFKTVTLAALREGAVVQPVQAGRIHDVSRLRPEGLPVLSYHSVSLNGRPGLHFKEAAIPGFFSIDPSGFSGWASWHRDARFDTIAEEDAKAFHHALHDLVVRTRRTKYRQTGNGPVPDGRFVLLALQVPDDAVSQHARLRPEETLDMLLDHYAGSDTAVVVKRHPYDVTEGTKAMLDARRARHPHLVVTTAPIHTLLERAGIVVTVNSGVGVEALVHLKQVISTGASDYAAATHAVNGKQEFEALLTSLDRGETGISALAIKRYLHAAYASHAFTSERIPEDALALIRKHLIMTARR